MNCQWQCCDCATSYLPRWTWTWLYIKFFISVRDVIVYLTRIQLFLFSYSNKILNRYAAAKLNVMDLCLFLFYKKFWRKPLSKWLDWLFLLPDYKRNVQIPGKKGKKKKTINFMVNDIVRPILKNKSGWFMVLESHATLSPTVISAVC